MLALSAVGVVAAFLVALVIATLPSVSDLHRAVGLGLRLDLALLLVLFGALGLVAVWVSAVPWFGPAVSSRDLLVPAIGIGLAAVEEVALHLWAAVSIGFYDWDFAWPNSVLSFLLVLVAIAWFAARCPGSLRP